MPISEPGSPRANGTSAHRRTTHIGRHLLPEEPGHPTPAGNDFAVVDRVIEVAREREQTPAKIALSWVLSKPGVASPIIGASKSSHLDDAIAALEIRLTEDEIRRLEEPYLPHRVLGHSYENPTTIAVNRQAEPK